MTCGKRFLDGVSGRKMGFEGKYLVE